MMVTLALQVLRWSTLTCMRFLSSQKKSIPNKFNKVNCIYYRNLYKELKTKQSKKCQHQRQLLYCFKSLTGVCRNKLYYDGSIASFPFTGKRFIRIRIIFSPSIILSWGNFPNRTEINCFLSWTTFYQKQLLDKTCHLMIRLLRLVRGTKVAEGEPIRERRR